ncbi:hypothetical protein BpHYR1_050052 [Brachionus plicatilis]|uniref:Uncharacterized protein n=1 Tax=Brachionus plicatilis TaxID=10195 RepID=A0A3M7S3W6_BRAPC|nr:hypothetical protein BpHYR1_050052 [Brachionus plicatilis]
MHAPKTKTQVLAQASHYISPICRKSLRLVWYTRVDLYIFGELLFTFSARPKNSNQTIYSNKSLI